MKTNNKPWWFPTKTDEAWLARIRADYEDKADWSDESLIDHFAQGQKYATLWDHTRDAYEQFEKLADAYLSLLDRAKVQQEAINEAAHCFYGPNELKPGTWGAEVAKKLYDLVSKTT